MGLAYTDRDLFQQTAQGNEAAFSELFRRYDKRIYPFVLKMVKDTGIAEEVTQEIFIKLWKNRERLTDIEVPEAYIFTITGRHTLDHIKRRLSESRMLQRLSLIQKNTHNDTEEALQLRDSAALIQKAVNNLPPQQKNVYQLSRQQGLKYDEIALQLNISQNTVRNHLVKALQTIREYMQEHNALPVGLLACMLIMIGKK